MLFEIRKKIKNPLTEIRISGIDYYKSTDKEKFKNFWLKKSDHVTIGNALERFLKIIFSDLKIGPNRVIMFPAKSLEYLRPIILKIPNKIMTQINCKKYLILFINF